MNDVIIRVNEFDRTDAVCRSVTTRCDVVSVFRMTCYTCYVSCFLCFLVYGSAATTALANVPNKE